MKRIHFLLQLVIITGAILLIISTLVAPVLGFYWLYWMIIAGFLQGGGSVFLNLINRFKHTGFRNHLFYSILYIILGILMYNNNDYLPDDSKIMFILLLSPAIILSFFYTWCSYKLAFPERKDWLDL